MKDLSYDVISPSKPTKRGKITDFSLASRRRLIDRAARLDVRKVRSAFLTLTFSGYPHPDKAKVSFRTFLKRVARKFPQTSALWRAEMQERGSPHFHLIIFNLPYWKQDRIQKTWEECTHESECSFMNYKKCKNVTNRKFIYRRRYLRNVRRSRVHIKLLRSHRAVMAYISKYIAKNTSLDNASYLTDDQNYDSVEKCWLGRHWGVFMKKNLPVGKRYVSIIRDEGIADYWWYTVRRLSRGRGAKNILVAKLFTQDGFEMFRFMVKMSLEAHKVDSEELDFGGYMSKRERRRLCTFLNLRAGN